MRDAARRLRSRFFFAAHEVAFLAADVGYFPLRVKAVVLGNVERGLEGFEAKLH